MRTGSGAFLSRALPRSAAAEECLKGSPRMGRKQGKGDLPVNETQGEAEKTDGQSTTQQLCFVLGLLLFGALFMVSVTSWYVHEYRGEHFFATERLESVSFDIAGTGNYVLKLGVNGEQYEIMRPRNVFKVLPYDFGVQGARRHSCVGNALAGQYRKDSI